jgi:ankyrin repeat protein
MAERSLYVAALNGNTDFVKRLVLISSSEDLESKDESGRSALWIASSNGHSETVKVLVQAGADIESLDKTYSATPLWIASQNGQRAVVEVLVSAGAVVESNDHLERSALYTAAAHGNPDVAAVLVDAGANIETEDIRCRAPLRAAARGGHLETVKFLIGAGAQVSPQLLPSSVASGSKELVQYLIQQGASAVFGMSLYHEIDKSLTLAIQRGNVDILQILLNCPDVLSTGGKLLSHRYRRLRSKAETSGSLSIYRMVMLLVTKLCTTRSIHRNRLPTILDFLGEDLFNKGFHLKELNSHSPPPVPNMSSQDVLDVIKRPGVGSVEYVPRNLAGRIFKETETTVESMIHRLNYEGWGCWQVSRCGSSAEGTSVGLPNEVDYLCAYSSSPGKFEMADIGEGYMYCYSGDEHAGMGRLFNGGSKIFHDQFWKALSSSGGEKVYEDSVIDMPMVQDGGHASTVILSDQFLPDSLDSFLVSIDLVPVLHFKDAWPEEGIQRTWLMEKDALKSWGFSLVAKPPRRKSKMGKSMAETDRVKLWRLSCSHLETEHIAKLDDGIKAAFIAAKCVRSPEVCRILLKDSDGVLYEVDTYITSYLLKTVFLHNVEDFLATSKTLLHMVYVIYTKLESCLTDGFLSNFWENHVNVLEGLSIDIQKSLQVAKLMTSLIRRWYDDGDTGEEVSCGSEGTTVSEGLSDQFAYYSYEFVTDVH